jgi:glutamate N-acetyltransferase / amino-acid N-acetyltransferase
MNDSGAIFLPKGFSFSAVTAGIKASAKPDLALILAEGGAKGAALFTKNLIVAAPVEVGRASLRKSQGNVRAVIVNSGNANCATGRAGIAACKEVCGELGDLIHAKPTEIFPSSTGIIGVPLQAEKITAKLQLLTRSAGNSVDHFRQFANAILTTDTRSKIASIPLRKGRAAITGVAKGSGMIHPQLATMLVYILTDVSASPSELRSLLRDACADTFNAISVDGDTSTNDTVLLLASGASGISLRTIKREFERALRSVCQSLAEQIVADGEGVQHVIRLRIEAAKSRAEALQIARAISHSLLVKTAWAGADPNWGRILAAIGRSEVRVNPAKVSIRIGEQVVCRGSVGCAFDEKLAHHELSQPESNITIRLGNGRASLDFLTTDLTADYVRINADYST